MSIIELAPKIFVGGNHPTFIIAEGGINHQGNVKIAKQLIEQAKLCGADCVKFQKRTISRILTKQGLDQPYTGNNSFGATYGEHKKVLELSFDDFREMKQYADQLGILFTASGWDEESVDFLDSIDVPFFKVASADLTNFPLLEHTAKKGKPMILSTGMANMGMVYCAVRHVQKFNKNIVLMQCTSSYPAPFEELDLNVIQTYAKKFPSCVVGYSGHEKGISVAIASCVLGAKVIEKHFTLDRCMKGSDHACSLEPEGLKKMIRDIRVVETSLGKFKKVIQPSEEACTKKLRKSIVSAIRIPKDTTITRDMLTVKGPGTGISPTKIDDIVGKITSVDIEEDILLDTTMFG